MKLQVKEFDFETLMRELPKAQEVMLQIEEINEIEVKEVNKHE